MTSSSGVAARWYLLALIPFAIGAGVFAGMYRMHEDIEYMPRVVVPGSDAVVLDPGDYIAYGETRSRVAGTVYDADPFQLLCNMQASRGVESITLTHPSVNESYSGFGFSGRSMFALTIAHAGTYRMSCEGDGGPATIAFGHGMGGAIVWAVAGLLGGLGAAIATALVVRSRRRGAGAARLPVARVV